ncbi:TetR family transcriptional regulator [Catenulispora sp. NF23]|uniref:TetR family transcriptional regulator n=1 Tax=Catenulispora pinistramenti TaxID=2705254 RepID=A0ABS5KL94_9ACTN|nr:TetR family transcriptional regulator [Catenulispora pinistramenti]MBS2531542.1 TetR family transcriptional regulator [Catenulispora pinistramenti]MBS2546811.1 TetR family transcriptional regulator [Catenulispora pinistramenti]
MGRWEPNARGRLEQAAQELYAERGFEQTTAAEIAERAGLTKRTFFRHFTDKCDVLFADADAMRDLIVKAAAETPESLAPLAAVAAGIQAGAAVLQEFQERARNRHVVIAATPELRERELAELAEIAAALAETLRGRGVGDRTASLAAETGIAVFKVTFGYWLEDAGQPELPQLLRDAFDELKVVTAGA